MMEQPIQPDSYADIYELVAWLQHDLQDQERRGIEENDLVWNIGYKNGNKKEHNDKIEFNFKFNFITLMKKMEYNKQDDYGNLIFPYQVNCNDVVFKYSVDFSYFVFNNNLNFMRSIFKMDVVFLNSTFNKIVSFKNSNFYKIADFSYSTLNFVVDFFGAIFNDRVCFDKTTFNEIVSFSKFTTKGTMEFRGSIFASEISFINITLDVIILFDNVIFDKDKCSVFFRNINYNEINKEFNECSENSKIKIINTIIDGRIDFKNVKVSKIDFEGSSVINGGVVSRVNFEAEPANSDTARFLKHEELTRSDTIKALKYKAIEKDLYYEELNDKIYNIYSKGKKKGDKSVRELNAELISIWLSRLSNNHGQDWLKAVLFTFATGLISLNLAYISLTSFLVFFTFLLIVLYILRSYYLEQKNDIKKIFKLPLILLITLCLNYFYLTYKGSADLFLTTYFNYLIPINFDLMKGVSNCLDNISVDKYQLQKTIPNCSQLKELDKFYILPFYGFYILGKIAIGYGIVQVIQAFRKFNIK